MNCCYVPLEKNYNKERKEFILRNANCKNILVDEDEELSINKINIKDIDIAKYEKTVGIGYNTPDSPNCVLYTSGTTGEPKGAVIVDRNIVKS